MKIVMIMLQVLAVAAVLVLMLAAGVRACEALDAPVVFRTHSGEVCGCITPEAYEYPTLAACDTVDMVRDLYEVRTVSKCK